jgi:phage gp36-like protein
MYCTIDDLRKQSSDEFLLRCTDDDGTGEINQTTVDEKIEDAQMEIDSYCRAQYPVPFQVVPGLIRKLTVDIALYNLVSKRGIDEDSPDAILVKRYRDAVKLLENLAKGIVTIGPMVAGEPSPQPQQAAIVSPPRLFTRTSMKGF